MLTPELFTHGAILSPDSSDSRVAIVGGGIAASILTQQILETSPSVDVHVFCKDEAIATRASGNKQGAVYPLLQTSNSPITRLMANSYSYALEYYKSLTTSGIEFEHEWCGVLQQAMTPDLEKRYTKLAQTWPQLCHYLDVQKSSQAAGLELPFESLLFPDGGWLAPQQLCRNILAKLKEKHNVTVHLNHAIEGLSQVKQQKWQIESFPDSAFDAVIVAGGHESAVLKQTNIVDLEPVSGQVSQLHNRSSLSPLKTVLCHKGYITPQQGQHQCFGATFNKGETNENPTIEQQEKNLAQIQQKYSEQNWATDLSHDDVEGNKLAIRATTSDHLPIAGEVLSRDWLLNYVDKNTGKYRRQFLNQSEQIKGDSKGLYLFTGLGARGLTTAPILAKHLVSLLFGLPSPLSEIEQKAIAPIRFKLRELKRHKGLL